MATIRTGRYIVTNVRQGNLATLGDANDGSPVAADTNDFVNEAKWNITRLGNGKYVFQNVGSANYANAGNRAPIGATVEGRNQQQQWVIQETRVKNQFTIATSDTGLFWGLPDDQAQTSVELSDRATDSRNWWTFTPTN